MVTYTDTVAVPEVGNATDVDVVLDVNMTEPSFEKSVTTLAVSEPILTDQSQGLKCNVPMFSENAVRAKRTVQKVTEEMETQNERLEDQFSDPDVERRISAIKAVSDVEIEHVLTKLHLLCSYCTKEQLETPVLQFFKENFPNLSFVKTEENGHLRLQ
ncbi:hypothetical protein ACLB2K_007476 [Fragaria x ananassa]